MIMLVFIIRILFDFEYDLLRIKDSVLMVIVIRYPLIIDYCLIMLVLT